MRLLGKPVKKGAANSGAYVAIKAAFQQVLKAMEIFKHPSCSGALLGYICSGHFVLAGKWRLLRI